MANIKSQIKRNRQNERRRLRNRMFRGAARTAVKDARASFEGGTETRTAVMEAVSTLDKAAQKGAIHPRNAARRKSRLMKKLAALGGIPSEPIEAPVVEEKVAAKPAKKEPRPKKEAPAKKAAKPSVAPAPKGKKPAATSSPKGKKTGKK